MYLSTFAETEAPRQSQSSQGVHDYFFSVETLANFRVRGHQLTTAPSKHGKALSQTVTASQVELAGQEWMTRSPGCRRTPCCLGTTARGPSQTSGSSPPGRGSSSPSPSSWSVRSRCQCWGPSPFCTLHHHLRKESNSIAAREWRYKE